MAWTERQQAMLRAMGIAVWTPPSLPALDDALVAAPDSPVDELPPVNLVAARPVVAEPAPTAAQSPAAEGPRAALAAPTAAPSAQRVAMGNVAAMDWPTLREAIAGCQACKLCESRTQTVFGVGHPTPIG
jgi:uracil-DNA glycosylase